MEKPSWWIVMCLIICLDGTGGEGFSYCFNRSWRNNQVTPSHSTNFFAEYLELTSGIAMVTKGLEQRAGRMVRGMHAVAVYR